jgi:hypothetical protein
MNTIIIEDINSNQFTCERVGEMEGFEYPSSRISIEDVSGARSSVYITSKAGRRRLSWQGVFIADFLESRRALESVLRQGSQKTIKFTTCDELDLQADVAIENLLTPYKLGRTKYIIEAVAADWRFYSQTLHTSSTSTTTILGGFGIPAAIPLDMSGGVGSVDGDIIDNAGTEITEPIFVINGSGTSFTITNVTTGDEMIIDYTLTASDYITIDVKNRTIVLNGTTNIYSALTSGDFFSLDPGENSLAFFATGSDVDTELTTSWRDAYIGI